MFGCAEDVIFTALACYQTFRYLWFCVRYDILSHALKCHFYSNWIICGLTSSIKSYYTANIYIFLIFIGYQHCEDLFRYFFFSLSYIDKLGQQMMCVGYQPIRAHQRTSITSIVNVLWLYVTFWVSVNR